jgi:hypothetical protein
MAATYDHRTWAPTERARHRKDDEIADLARSGQKSSGDYENLLFALIVRDASNPSAHEMCWANAIIAANDTLCYRGLGANRLSDLSVIGFTPFG